MEHKNIYVALNAAMQEVGYVQKKRDEKSQLNYTFAGEAALIAAIRPALVAHGITVAPSGVRELRSELYTTAKGAVMNRTLGIFAFHIHHGDSDTGFDVEVLGEAADSGDKSAAKAMTGAFKYALRQTFAIETGDDPDEFGSEDQQRDNGKQNGNAASASNTVLTEVMGEAHMSSLTGAQIALARKHSTQQSGLNDFKWNARLAYWYPGAKLNQITSTVKEFIDTMNTPEEIEG